MTLECAAFPRPEKGQEMSQGKAVASRRNLDNGRSRFLARVQRDGGDFSNCEKALLLTRLAIATIARLCALPWQGLSRHWNCTTAIVASVDFFGEERS
jgi:hypothetical protein